MDTMNMKSETTRIHATLLSGTSKKLTLSYCSPSAYKSYPFPDISFTYFLVAVTIS
jgi:hypothetical protein